MVFTRHSGLVIVVLDFWPEGHGMESQLWWLHFDGGEILGSYVFTWKHRMLEISTAFYYDVPRNHVVLGRKVPKIINLRLFQWWLPIMDSFMDTFSSDDLL